MHACVCVDLDISVAPSSTCGADDATDAMPADAPNLVRRLAGVGEQTTDARNLVRQLADAGEQTTDATELVR